MEIAFYIVATIAVLSTIRVITHAHVIHALLYFIVSLLSVAFLFYLLGAPFVAALEVIIYAGAIMVLFLFVIMMLSFGKEQLEQERAWTNPGAWVGPGAISALLLLILAWVLHQESGTGSQPEYVGPVDVGFTLFGPYLIGVQLAALLLLSGLVGASHLRRHERGSVLRTDETPALQRGPEASGEAREGVH